MLTIVLIRPGSTDYDVQQRIQGSLDIPLNEQGVEEARQTAEKLQGMGLKAIFAPASQPSLETAEIIADILDIKRKKLDKVQNLDQGLWQGMLVNDVKRKQPRVYKRWQEQPENVCPPEGEMLGEADERVRAAVVKIMKRRKEGPVGLVLPEPLFSLARRFITHCELGDLWKAPNGHGRFEPLEIDAEEFLAAGV